jgi:uncharacterized DUF497 family protein
MSGIFDWDDGNWPKCAKHGLTQADIEAVFLRRTGTTSDPSEHEIRFRAVGPAIDGRMAFVVFPIRELDGRSLVRPISARYMHEKEIRRYEQSKAKAVPDLQQ